MKSYFISNNNLTKLKSELEELEEIEKINTKNSYTVKIETHNEIIDDEISPMNNWCSFSISFKLNFS